MKETNITGADIKEVIDLMSKEKSIKYLKLFSLDDKRYGAGIEFELKNYRISIQKMENTDAKEGVNNEGGNQ